MTPPGQNSSSGGKMHSADFDRSERLQAVYALLCDGAEYSTLDIVKGAGVCAVNSCIAELRANGFPIECRQGHDPVRGKRIWIYRLLRRAGWSA